MPTTLASSRARACAIGSSTSYSVQLSRAPAARPSMPPMGPKTKASDDTGQEAGHQGRCVIITLDLACLQSSLVHPAIAALNHDFSTHKEVPGIVGARFLKVSSESVVEMVRVDCTVLLDTQFICTATMSYS